MDIIKKRNKKRNILNIKFNNYNLIIIFFILFLLISLEESNCKLTKLNHISKILITIKGRGNQAILNKNNNGNKYFNYTPSEIYINNNTKNINDNLKYNLTLEENNITLIFNQSLEHCNWLFYNLKNITKIDFLEFDSSNLIEMIETFGNCINLKSINLSVLNTSKVRNMS